jgi:hypothetical protein
MPLFDLLETEEKKIIMEHEQLCILDSSLEDMFEFINYYGNFTERLEQNLDRYKFLTRSGLHYGDETMMFAPEKHYEMQGDVNGVVFPCGWVLDEPTGEIKIYYGGADSCIALATAQLSELLAYMKTCPRPNPRRHHGMTFSQ